MSITPCRPKWKGTMTDRERFNNRIAEQRLARLRGLSWMRTPGGQLPPLLIPASALVSETALQIGVILKSDRIC